MNRPREQRSRLQAVPRHGHDVDDLVFSIEGRPLIEPGSYEALGGDCRVQKHKVFGQEKAVLDMIVRVPDPDAEFGFREELLQRFWNAKRVNGRWHFGRSSTLAREWVIATGTRLARHQRTSPRVFKGVLFKVTVRTVCKNFEQKLLPEHAHYSVVDKIIERVAGGAFL